MKATHSFEHELWKFLKTHSDPLRHKYVLAVSGGVDSTALLAAWSQIVSVDQVIVVHVHHGESENLIQLKFRNESAQNVENFCKNKKLKYQFLKISNSTSMTNENEFRKQRYEFLHHVKNEFNADWIVTAHHQEDLLETRVHRLLRGTGGQGLMAMRTVDEGVLRPLLSTSKKTLKTYLQELNISWFDDPSNLSTDPFRNWIRQELLPVIENRDSGLLVNLHRSLQIIAEEIDQDSSRLEKFYSKTGIQRQDYFLLSNRDQEKLIALYLRAMNKSNWTAGLLSEIRKHLDRNENNFEFSIGPLHWIVNSQVLFIK